MNGTHSINHSSQFPTYKINDLTCNAKLIARSCNLWTNQCNCYFTNWKIGQPEHQLSLAHNRCRAQMTNWFACTFDQWKRSIDWFIQKLLLFDAPWNRTRAITTEMPFPLLISAKILWQKTNGLNFNWIDDAKNRFFVWIKKRTKEKRETFEIGDENGAPK